MLIPGPIGPTPGTPNDRGGAMKRALGLFTVFEGAFAFGLVVVPVRAALFAAGGAVLVLVVVGRLLTAGGLLFVAGGGWLLTVVLGGRVLVTAAGLVVFGLDAPLFVVRAVVLVSPGAVFVTCAATCVANAGIARIRESAMLAAHDRPLFDLALMLFPYR
jgi:hypothetical protein